MVGFPECRWGMAYNRGRSEETGLSWHLGRRQRETRPKQQPRRSGPDAASPTWTWSTARWRGRLLAGAGNPQDRAPRPPVGDLVRRDESEMLKFRNFGRKSLQELMQVIVERNLQFGMDVDRFLEDVKS